MKTITMTDRQAARLRDLVNDRQDYLFDRLQATVKAGNEPRAAGLRESLKFWDEIDRSIRDAPGHCDGGAVSAGHAIEAP